MKRYAARRQEYSEPAVPARMSGSMQATARMIVAVLEHTNAPSVLRTVLAAKMLAKNKGQKTLPAPPVQATRRPSMTRSTAT